MKMSGFGVLSISICALLDLQAPILRDQVYEVPLVSGTIGGIDWGLATRDADHATVAISSSKDLAIAFHTDRTDVRPTSFESTLKQVEVALFRYVPGPPEYWTYVTTLLLGSVEADPLGAQQVNNCSRPDVIAVGERFFVTWTRNYDESLGPAYATQPSVLECAWIVKQGTSFALVGGAMSGLGFELDRHTSNSALSSSGSVDAVNLGELEGPGTWTAGVVYKHQTAFHSTTPGIRRFDLRFLTCTLHPSMLATGTPASLLVSDIEFDGFDFGPGGVVLPDLAEASTPTKFWMTYEEKLGTASTGPECLVHLQLIARNAGGVWTQVPRASTTFGSPASTLWRRRPNISTAPVQTFGAEIVTLAFVETPWLLDSDVRFEQLIFNGVQNWRVPIAVGRGFPNALNVDDREPLPVHGNESGRSLRCYVARNNGRLSRILEYDAWHDRLTVMAETSGLAQRPAADYLYDPAQPAPHYTSLIWEQRDLPTAGYRTKLRVR